MKFKYLFWLCLVALVGCTDSWDDEQLQTQQGMEIIHRRIKKRLKSILMGISVTGSDCTLIL